MRDPDSKWTAVTTMRKAEGGDPRLIPYLVLDYDGTLLVRLDWFARHVRKVDQGVGTNARIVEWMERIGWRVPGNARKGNSGRIRIRDPRGVEPSISWRFLIVPKGWDE